MIEILQQNHAARDRRAAAVSRRIGEASNPGLRRRVSLFAVGCAAFLSAGTLTAQPSGDQENCVSFAACESRILELRAAGADAAALKLFETLAEDEDGAGLSDAARLLKARLLLDRNRLREAATIYEDLCGSVQSHGCWNALGVVRMSLGGYREAVTAFQKSLRIEATARTHSNLAVAYSYLRKLNAARDQHDRALAMQPRGVQVRLNFGVFLFNGRRFDEAGKIFTTVIADAPEDFYARLYMGRVHTMRRDYQAALREFDRGVELNREFFDLYYHRAVVRAKLKDPGGALSDLNRADRINPVNGLTDALRASIKRRRP